MRDTPFSAMPIVLSLILGHLELQLCDVRAVNSLVCMWVCSPLRKFVQYLNAILLNMYQNMFSVKHSLCKIIFISYFLTLSL